MARLYGFEMLRWDEDTRHRGLCEEMELIRGAWKDMILAVTNNLGNRWCRILMVLLCGWYQIFAFLASPTTPLVCKEKLHSGPSLSTAQMFMNIGLVISQLLCVVLRYRLCSGGLNRPVFARSTDQDSKIHL